MRTVRYLFGNLIPGFVLMSLGIYLLVENYYNMNSPINLNYYPMKASTYILLCIAGFLAMSTAFIACGGAERRTVTDYVVLIDETDSTFSVPNTDELLSDLRLDTNMWNGVNFTLARIADVSYTPHSSFSLSKGGSRLASNQYGRKREVDAFKAKVTTLLDSVRRDKPGKPNSSIWIPLVNELTRLANSKADHRVLIVSSDLMEHTRTVSFYDKHTFVLLRSDPTKIEERLFAESELPNLDGIEVHFVHEPKNAQEDAVFLVVSDFYKKLLEGKGATVTISANLTNP